MTKTEFLDEAIKRFLGAHPGWAELTKEKRNLYYSAGREIDGRCLVFVDFSVRPDRFTVGHGVGWTKSRARFKDWRQERVNPPIQPRDGSLRRLLTLDDPRDFKYEELSISTSALCKPFGGFNVPELSVEQVFSSMATEARDYALPYLCLMLRKRFGLEMSPEQLAKEA